ncbi:hypothetical protein E0M27_03045 [Bacillus mycoides]|nr:hypothetical protein EXW46_19285 [Bacillus mycoides]TBX60549.1 hypothetical protein E0M27_03045 [Bacillus mycoides]
MLSSILQTPLDQLIKRIGKVIRKVENRFPIEQDGLEIVARVTPEVSKLVNYTYTPAFRVPVPNSPLIRKKIVVVEKLN